MPNPISDVVTSVVMPSVGVSGQILHTVTSYSYLDDDGDMAYGWHLEGDPTFVESFGLMEVTKLRMMAHAYDWDDHSA